MPRFGSDEGKYVSKMTETDAAKLFRTDPRRATVLWDEEFQRRHQAMLNGQPDAERWFMRWQRLVCDNCGAGPGQEHRSKWCF